MKTQKIIELLAMLIGGGIFVKIWDTFFLSKKDKDSSLLMLVERLQAEIDRLQNKQDAQETYMQQLRADYDMMRDKYLLEIEQKISLQGEVVKLTAELKKFNKNN